jgi:5-methylcytosine-specific restriction endonuclease McrA
MAEKWKLRLATNPEARRMAADHVRRWRLANPEKDSANHAAWKRANPGKLVQYTHARRAKKYAGGGTYTAEEAATLLIGQDFLCANPYCQIDLRDIDSHLDHKTPLTRDGSNTIENLQWLCQPCNNRKWTYTNEEWLVICAAQDGALRRSFAEMLGCS